MKIIMYSGGQARSNHRLHQALSDLVGRKKKKSLAYIPFCADGAQSFYLRAIRRYQPFGFKEFRFLAADEPFSKDALKRVFDSDAIYLAGGNTFYFLKHLRKSGLLPRLKRYAKQGGVLAGLSAGAIMMTPTIGLAGYPKSDADENEVGLKDLRALGLVEFEFFPHFEDTRGLREMLRRYSLRSRHPILAARDGGGVQVRGEELTLFGKVAMWSRGNAIGI